MDEITRAALPCSNGSHTPPCLVLCPLSCIIPFIQHPSEHPFLIHRSHPSPSLAIHHTNPIMPVKREHLDGSSTVDSRYSPTSLISHEASDDKYHSLSESSDQASSDNYQPTSRSTTPSSSCPSSPRPSPAKRAKLASATPSKGARAAATAKASSSSASASPRKQTAKSWSHEEGESRTSSSFFSPVPQLTMDGFAHFLLFSPPVETILLYLASRSITPLSPADMTKLLELLPGRTERGIKDQVNLKLRPRMKQLQGK